MYVASMPQIRYQANPFLAVNTMEVLPSYGTVYMVLTLKSADETLADETLVCDHSNESYWAVISCGTVCYARQGGSVDENLLCDNLKLLDSI